MAKEERWSRRKFLKTAFFTGLLAAFGTPFYSYYYERRRLTVSEVSIPLPESARAMKGLRVAHFSDLHFGFHLGTNDVERVVNVISSAHADLICFTGDVVDGGIERLEELVPLFSRLQATYGKFAILGNHDYGTSEEERKVRHVWEASGFHCLANRHVLVDGPNGPFAVAGIEDALIGSPDLREAVDGIPRETPILLLAHEPDVADKSSQYPYIHLQLSGHSHGGQIRVPFVGAAITPPLGRKYVSGLYRLRQENFAVYTSRGIGTTTLPFRLNCPPEIAILELL